MEEGAIAFADNRLTFGCPSLTMGVWYNESSGHERHQRGEILRDRATTNRIILLIAVAVVLAVMVLFSSIRLLPPPPGPPTPTAPYVLDRPEGKPRILH
jgi:hypothetical protein